MSLPSPSKLELADECLFPFTSGEDWLDIRSDHALFGNAVHEAADRLVTAPDEQPDLDEIAERHKVPEKRREEFEQAVEAVAERLAEEREDMLEARAELYVAYDLEKDKARLVLDPSEPKRPGEIRGKIDLLFKHAERGLLVVRDWKTGRRLLRKRPADQYQILFYAVAVSRLFGVDELVVELAFVSRDGVQVIPAYLDAFAIDSAKARLDELAAACERPSLPVYGAHCKALHCPIAHKCPAVAAAMVELDEASKLRGPLDAEQLKEATDEQVADAWLRLAGIEQRVEQIRAVTEERIRSMGSTIPVHGGMVLGVREHRGNESIKWSDETEKILAERLGSRADEAVTKRTTKKSIERAAKALEESMGNAQRGAGLKRYRGILAALNDAGQIKAGAPYTKVEVFEPPIAAE